MDDLKDCMHVVKTRSTYPDKKQAEQYSKLRKDDEKRYKSNPS